MRFGVLGPLLVSTGESAIAVPGVRARVLLAALLLRTGQAVPADTLAEIVWDGSPPGGSVATLRSHVMRLRRALGPVAGSRLVTRYPGYLVEADTEEVDLLRFTAKCREGRVAAQNAEWEQAAALLAEALELWRGEPLADIPSQTLLREEVPRLEQARLQALEWRGDADLHLGRHDEMVPGLRELTARYPLRERFHAQLMLALYRCGRQAEALEVYRAVRGALASELGVEPAAELQQMHRQMLSADPVLAARPATEQAASGAVSAQPVAGQAAQVVPRELPLTVRYFAGRQAELTALDDLLAEAAGPAGTVVVCVIAGTAGVGKTALAVHWAHQHADRFPDGQLYVDLRGFGPSGEPVQAAVAVRRFLDALPVPAGRIPADLDAQVSLYRSLLAGKQMLIVLDNARDAEQVRSLLPGATGCMVLITSRSHLDDLVTLDGAVPLTVDLLTEDEARELLVSRLTPARIAGEQAAVGELTGLCARLPLALNIAASRVAARPGTPLGSLAAELRGTRRRLDLLSAGTGTANLRAVFSWSYQTLTGPGAWMFRLLGVHPGPDISVAAAASLAAVDHDQARRTLDELTASHLLTEYLPGRYGLHDLLRAYAAEQAETGGEQAETGAGHADVRAAVARVLDHYLHTARSASLLLYPARDLGPVSPLLPGTVPEPLDDDKQALAWFDGERRVLLVATALAARERFDTHAWQIPSVLAGYLERGGHWYDYADSQSVALRAAEHAGDLAGQANASLLLGRAYGRIGSHQDAEVYLRRALRLYRALGDQAGQAHAQHSLGWMLGQQHRYRQALHRARLALSLYRAAGHRTGEARALNTVGWYGSLLGLHQQALTFCQQAAELHHELGNHDGEADAWDSLGHAHHHLGHSADAVLCYQRALSLFQMVGDRLTIADTLGRLGDAHQAAGQPRQARDAWQQALHILTDLAHPQAATARAKLASLEIQLDAVDQP